MQFSAETLPKIVCVTFTRTAVSPPTFDEDQKQHNIACPWAQSVAADLGRLEAEKLPVVDINIVPPLPDGVTDRYLVQLRETLCAQITQYSRAQAAAQSIAGKLQRSDIENMFIFLGPYLVSLAIGLALFKSLYGPVSLSS